MLCLRVARGASPTTLLRRLLLVVMSAGAAFLLLCSLGIAVAHPERADVATVRLMWCVVPVFAAVQLAAAISRLEPLGGLGAGLAAAGGSSRRLSVLAAGATGVSCGLGSLIALAAFLYVRPRFTLSAFHGGRVPAAVSLEGLPVAATATLLAVVPMAGAAASAAALRPRSLPSLKPRPLLEDEEDQDRSAAEAAERRAALPAGLPWGVALACVGVVLEVYASRWELLPHHYRLPLPGGFGSISPTMLAGWSLTAAALVIAGPGLVHLSGRLLCWVRPGAVRLLAGRGLEAEAYRVGRPLGMLCALGSAAVAAFRLWNAGPEPRPGLMTLVGAGVLVISTLATVLTAGTLSKDARRPTVQMLHCIGAPKGMLREAVALRVVTLVVVLGPVTWMVGELAALPLYLG